MHGDLDLTGAQLPSRGFSADSCSGPCRLRSQLPPTLLLSASVSLPLWRLCLLPWLSPSWLRTLLYLHSLN